MGYSFLRINHCMSNSKSAEAPFPLVPKPHLSGSIDHGKPLLEGKIVRVYGHKFPHNKFNNMFAIELWCFLHGITPEQGGLGKFGHFKNAVDLWFNVPESKKHFDWHPWALEMAQFACENNYLAIAGCASSGKCLGKSTKVLMFDGSIKLAPDIVVGDLLMGDDSTPRRVLSTNTGRSNMVRIVPKRGQSWECNDDHILCLKRTWSGESSQKRVGEITELSVKDYLNKKGPAFRARHRQYSVGVEFPEQPVEFDPQIYGLWLGDGTTKEPTLTAHDSEVEVTNFWCSYFNDQGYPVSNQRYSGSCPAWRVNRKLGHSENYFSNFIRGSVVGGKKRIRREYLINSRENRLKLLAGIIDTDGHASDSYFEVSCSNDGLAEDITFLARSLGFGTTCVKRMTSCNGKKFPSNRINICGNVEEIPTLRKKCKLKTLRMNSNCTGFDVVQLGEGDWCGFTLDGNGRFLLDDFTVTHNTDFGAIWAIINWLASPLETMVLVTSTSLKDSRKRIWGSIREYFMARPGLPGKLVDSYGQIRLSDPSGEFAGSDRCGISLVAAEKKMEKEAVGKLIGFKNSRVLLIADELPEISEAILEAAYGNLSRNPFFQLIGLGNPNSLYDAFGTFARPKAGWNSISAESHTWETDRGMCLRFDGKYSPNIMAGQTVYPYLLTQDRYDDDARLFGENSATFWRMIRGFWSPTGSSEGVYTESEIVQYRAEDKAIWLGDTLQVAALDPSFTNGGDRTAAIFGTYGKNTDGLMTLQFNELILIREDVTDKSTPRTFQIAKQFVDLCEKRGVLPKHAALDVSGGGGPFADVVTSLWSNQFHRVNFAGKASENPISVFDQTKSCDRYANRVTEIWFSGKELLRTGQLKGVFPELAKEMCARLYTTEKSGTAKVRVEPKPIMKARTGESPDIADAAFILLDLCRDRLQMSSVAYAGDRQEVKNKGWKFLARKYDLVSRGHRQLRRE